MAEDMQAMSSARASAALIHPEYSGFGSGRV